MGSIASTSLLSVLLSLPCAMALAQTTGTRCDPDLAADKQVIALRDSRHTDAALQAAQAILKAHPDNFRANYLLADVIISGGTTSAARDGLAQLLVTERMLAKQPLDCVRNFGWYSIYNTIGVQYNRLGDDNAALKYFLIGYNHLNDMLANTKILILNNLGLMYFKKYDLANSLKFYQLAQANHSATAKAHIDAIRLIQKGK